MNEMRISNNLCLNGHTVLWAGSTTGDLPENVPCCCGLTVTHYTVCKECGNRTLEFVPAERIENGQSKM
jgi:hypothetical protein